MEQDKILKLFKKHKALLAGHFRLSSGLHSENYLQCALILQYPKLAAKFAKEIAMKFSGENIDLVIGPALGGITLAYEVARAMGVRGIFTERQDAKMVLRRGFSIAAGEKALVVEDVITTGGSTKEVIEVVRASGGIISGVASIMDRSGEPVDFGTRFEPLARITIKTFKEEDCPLCKKGIPVAKPGSRK